MKTKKTLISLSWKCKQIKWHESGVCVYDYEGSMARKKRNMPKYAHTHTPISTEKKIQQQEQRQLTKIYIKQNHCNQA